MVQRLRVEDESFCGVLFGWRTFPEMVFHFYIDQLFTLIIKNMINIMLPPVGLPASLPQALRLISLNYMTSTNTNSVNGNVLKSLNTIIWIFS